jgi:membrane protein implicated in regulation of membrane protease activity
VPAWVWLCVALILGALELATTTFVLMWIAVAALLTAGLALGVPQLQWQAVWFAAVSAVLLLATRSVSRRWRANRLQLPQPQHALVGKRGRVVTGAEPGALGTVQVQGHIWSCRSDARLQAGDEVVVQRVNGAVLTVTSVAQDVSGERSESV